MLAPAARPSSMPWRLEELLDHISEPHGLSTFKAWPLTSASYAVIEHLGSGTFASAFAARRRSTWECEMDVALKVVRRHTADASRELEINCLLRDSRCPHVARCLEWFLISSSPSSLCTPLHLVLVLERFDEDLREHILRTGSTGRAPAWRLMQAQCIGRCLVAALAHVHALSIVHRDIKPDNVLVQFSRTEQPRFVLSDFGAAKRLVRGEPNCTFAFADFYRAPELFFGCTTYETAPDMWAFGATLAEVLLSGAPLFAPACEEGSSDQSSSHGIDAERAQSFGVPDSLPSRQRQLLALFDALGTPSRADIQAMNPALTDERAKAWMRLPPRSPSHGWRQRILVALGPCALAGIHSSHVATALLSLLEACFSWDPAARPLAEGLAAHPFLASQ